MSCVVTGAAGFIGSHLSEKLISLGYDVTGIDNFSDYYPREYKLRNLKDLKKNPKFRLIELDLASRALNSHGPKPISENDYIFHLAAQPGVRSSWGNSFERYVKDNIIATQHILELLKESKIAAKQMIFASSSSVYGDAETHPTNEETIPRPVSPYGVTKLACEALCRAYCKNFDLPIVVLRYFTVYGPRQRPDMAFHKFINSIHKQEEIEIFGNGEQTRDFTFVSDIVMANIQAINARKESLVYNIGSSQSFSINQILGMMEEIIGKKAKINYLPSVKGDVRHTSADISKASLDLRYEPRTLLKDGLQDQIKWQLQRWQ